MTVLKHGITLYLIRHGETDWNREARYQGQRDIPLNTKGREQARGIGRSLAQFLPGIAELDFVSSPLGRASETMELLRGELGLPLKAYRTEPELLELKYGHWEGQLAGELATDDAEGVAAKAKDPFSWRPTGGESYADLMDRISRWLQTIERATVAVTHGGVSRVARGAILNLNTRDVPFLEVPQDRTLVLRDGTMRWI